MPQVQVKLLRVLGRQSQREFIRLGGEETIKTNVRVLAATNKDLLGEMRGALPRGPVPSAVGAGDSPAAPARAHLRHSAAHPPHHRAHEPGRGGTHPHRQGVDEALIAYHWPGNIRQLESVLLRAIVLYGQPDELDADDVHRALELEAGYAAVSREAKLECPDPVPDGWFWDEVFARWKLRRLSVVELEELVRGKLAESGGFIHAPRCA